ncbi:hypothetical protein [Pseudomonas sp.]|uniref:hypothetical protein n=1 Tax=Pseudomonas sp. TaxID=306 RepID=UPI0029082F37|nr:hypothetical protein [Pseudomonas sp.]MDU4254412.1 hypothetical protein [Pseudomonas sp.]
MALICAFGTAPEQAAEGYSKLLRVETGTDQMVAKRYARQDVRLVRGAAIFGQPGAYEFAVLVPAPELILGNRITGPYSAMVDGADTGLAGCTDVGRCSMADKCLRNDDRLACKSAHMGRDSVCRFLIEVGRPQPKGAQHAA